MRIDQTKQLQQFKKKKKKKRRKRKLQFGGEGRAGVVNYKSNSCSHSFHLCTGTKILGITETNCSSLLYIQHYNLASSNSYYKKKTSPTPTKLCKYAYKQKIISTWNTDGEGRLQGDRSLAHNELQIIIHFKKQKKSQKQNGLCCK